MIAKRKISLIELFGESKSYVGQSFHPQNRKSKSDPIQYTGICLQGTGLSAGRFSGIQERGRYSISELNSFIEHFNVTFSKSKQFPLYL